MNNLVGLSELWRLHQQTPHSANTHNHFVTTLVGLIKFKQVGKKKNHVTQTVFFNIHKEMKKNRGRSKRENKASSPCDYSLKLGIIRSQTWFTPCSSLIVLKSSVTRRRRRGTAASKSTYMCRRERTHTHTIGLDRE